MGVWLVVAPGWGILQKVVELTYYCRKYLQAIFQTADEDLKITRLWGWHLLVF